MCLTLVGGKESSSRHVRAKCYVFDDDSNRKGREIIT